MRTERNAGRRPSVALTLSLAAALAAGAAGCGGNAGEVATVPAAGTVNFKGKPLESGTIQLVPENGRTASGTITNGKFTLTTYNEGDGAIPGKHQVAIVSTKEKAPAKKGGEPETVYIVPQSFSSA